LIQQGAESIL